MFGIIEKSLSSLSFIELNFCKNWRNFYYFVKSYYSLNNNYRNIMQLHTIYLSNTSKNASFKRDKFQIETVTTFFLVSIFPLSLKRRGKIHVRILIKTC